ncbi:hypothetical protein RRG08_036117 [Elysia crispata]|uniref:Uncharacterized protein n=1 Tax=Elysia crispata TaxID=231223 RepID=A0AAE1E0K0_9GAST|nr:hypothetical protein RRG08_036117 [Elysia crispata]
MDHESEGRAIWKSTTVLEDAAYCIDQAMRLRILARPDNCHTEDEAISAEMGCGETILLCLSSSFFCICSTNLSTMEALQGRRGRTDNSSLLYSQSHNTLDKWHSRKILP